MNLKKKDSKVYQNGSYNPVSDCYSN